MTTLSLTRPNFDFGLIRPLRSLGRNVERFFGSMVAAQQAANDYQRMSNRTDAQLAANGTSRADIAREIFERHYA